MWILFAYEVYCFYDEPSFTQTIQNTSLKPDLTVYLLLFAIVINI